MISKILQSIRIPYREDSLFGIILISLFIVPLFFLPVVEDLFETPRFALSMLFVGLALVIFFFRKTIEWRFSKVLAGSLLAFLFISFISAIFGVDFNNSIFGIYGRYANSLVFLVLWTALIFLIGLQNSRDKILVFMKMFLFSGFMVGLLGILHSYEIFFYFGVENTQRTIIPSFIGNQNFAAMFLIGVIPFLLPVLKDTKTLIWKTIYSLFGVISIWALMVFASRGAILAFAVAMTIGLVIILFRKIEWKYRLVVSAMLVAGVFFAIFFYSTTRLEETTDSLDVSNNVSAQTRVTVWGESTDLILQNPILGMGLGNFYIGFRSLGNISLPGSERFDDAHNLYLHNAVSSGVPAAIIFLFIVIMPLYVSMRNYFREGSLISWAISIGLIALLVSFCFSPVNISLWFLLAFLISASQFVVDPKTFDVNTLRSYKKIIAIILGVLLIVLSLLFMTSEILTLKTKQAYRKAEFQKAYSLGKISILTNPINSIARLYATASMIKLGYNPEDIRSAINKFENLHENSSGTQKYAADLYFMLYKKTNDSKDLQASFGHMEKERSLEPNFAPVLVGESYLYYKAGEIDKAKELLNNAVTLESQGRYYFAWLLLAQIYLEEKNYTQMIHALRQVKELRDPNSIETGIILDNLINSYEKGEFNLEKLPIAFPEIDV